MTYTKFALTAALAISATFATAQVTTNRVAAEKDWSVFVAENPKECFAVTQPKETVNTRGGQVVSVTRSDIRFFVFYRPGANVKGQVAFTGGYPFAEGRGVTLDVDGSKFTLSAKGEWAWPASAEEDAKIVNAMKRGASATITAQSGRGTVTKDTFSLSGFTKAVTTAAQNCS